MLAVVGSRVYAEAQTVKPRMERNSLMMTRRQALRNTALASAACATVFANRTARAQPKAATASATTTATIVNGPFILPPLPYPFDALEPHIDARTMEIHHDKHHA